MDYQKLLALSVEVGQQLLLCGGEIYRVEDSISYLLSAYGVRNAQVFAIPNCIIVSMTTPDLEQLSVMRRVRGGSTDIRRLESVNDLCRRLCAETPDLDTAIGQLAVASSTRSFCNRWQRMLAYGVGTGFFAFLFGGNGWDALAAAICGILVGVELLLMSQLAANLFFKTILGSFICGVVALILATLGVCDHLDVVITSALMALAPGVVITNFMRDIMVGDMVSGLSKLADALLTGAGMALGSGIALTLGRMALGVLAL